MAKKKKKAAKKKVVKKKKARRRTRGLWSKDDTALLKKLFSTTPTAQIAKQVKRKTDAVKKKAARMGLSKSKKYLRSLGRS